MIKVKCVTNLNMLYFAGETYEIPQQVYDENPTCFIPIQEPEKAVNITVEFGENKMLTPDDITAKDAELDAGNLITDADDQVTADTDAGSSDETTAPNLDEMSYAELKALADSKGIEYKHNISTAALIELLK